MVKIGVTGNGGEQVNGGNMGPCGEMLGNTGYWVESCRLQV